MAEELRINGCISSIAPISSTISSLIGNFRARASLDIFGVLTLCRHVFVGILVCGRTGLLGVMGEVKVIGGRSAILLTVGSGV